MNQRTNQRTLKNLENANVSVQSYIVQEDGSLEIENVDHQANFSSCSSAQITQNLQIIPAVPIELEESVEITEPLRKRGKTSKRQKWDVTKNQHNREKGKPYMGKIKINNKWKFVEPKPMRELKERCKCKLSLKGNTKLQCGKITLDDRKLIWENFWNLTWNEKRLFVQSFSNSKTKARVKTGEAISRRQNSVELFLHSRSNKNRFRVCKTMFLNTLSIGKWAIKKWVIGSQNNIENEEPRTRPRNNEKPESMKLLKQFLEQLPKMESHYCRKDSSKLYLEPTWVSKAQLYKLYKDDYCITENVEALSLASFLHLFDQMNVSLFRPKKDLCDVCESFKTKNLAENLYQLHIEKKTEARSEKENDKKSNHLVLTMDLQSVLLCPKSNVSSLYYKTKLIVHNFTLYDIQKKKGYCFIWNETEGKLTANEFSTIIVTALEKMIVENPLETDQEIIIYSDGCTYQNRNAVLANALANFCMENKVVVMQKYLEKGHTQMECDCMHSLIEKAMRPKKVNAPADYIYLAKTACKKSPYNVTCLYHDFFRNIEGTFTFYKSIRPGKKVGDPAVTDIRALRYSPNGAILYKLRHSDTQWQELPTRVKNIEPIPFETIPKLYSARLPIKKEKFQHLQELKTTMERDYHNFYDNLPHL